MPVDNSAENNQLVSRETVTKTLHRLIRQEVYTLKRISLEQIAAESGIPIRRLRSYIDNQSEEQREPPASALLSILMVLGDRSVNSMTSLIGYAAYRHDDEPITEVADRCIELLSRFSGVGRVS